MQPYTSDALPLADLDYARLIAHIGPARYDGLLQSVLNTAEGRQVI